MSHEADMDRKLIEMVEQFPGLYDRSSANYKNPESVATMWEIISKKLTTPRDELERRWKYLRKRFTRTIGPNWQHYNSLTFLEPFIKRRKLLTNNSTELKDDEVIIVEECEDKNSDILKQRKKKRKMISSEEDEPTTHVHSFREKKPEEDSVHSFCNSICNDLLKLSSQQMLNCRIDILTVIQKYTMQTNDLNTSNVSNSSNAETLVPELMKHFVQVENKIMEQEMKSNDTDWVFLFTIKNFLSKMMVLRKHNAELDDLLKNFQFVDQMNARNRSVHSETSFFPTTTSQCSTNSYSEANDEAKDVKNEVTSSETRPSPADPVYFEETKLREILPFEVASLKENILLDGITNDGFCNICDMKAINTDSHKKIVHHVSARKNYFRNFCIRNVNPLIFEIRNERLQCIFCSQPIFSLWYLKKHILHNMHIKKTKSVVEEADSNWGNYVEKGVLKIGTSFRFCLLCQEHIFGIPHHNKGLHKRNLLEIETCCLVKNDIYCFLCKKSFPVVEYENHRNEQGHKINFKYHYMKNRNQCDN